MANSAPSLDMAAIVVPGLTDTDKETLLGALPPKVINALANISNNGGVVIPKTVTPEFYGALGDGIADDYAAIQTALDAVGAAGGGIVYLRPTKYFISHPIWMRYSNVTMRSLSKDGTIIAGTNNGAYGGPMIYIGPDAALQATPGDALSVRFDPPLVNGLETAGTQSINFGFFYHWASTGIFNLNENGNLNWNGNSAFSAECYIKINSYAAWTGSTAYALNAQVQNSGNIYQCITAGTSASSGGPTGNAQNITDGSVHWQYIAPVVSTAAIVSSAVTAGHTYAAGPKTYMLFGLNAGAGNLPYPVFELETSTGHYTVGGTTFTTGVVHHLAATFDGTHLRVFVDGVLAGTTNTSGASTLVHPDHEDTIVGGMVSVWPENGLVQGPPDGVIYGLRIGKDARYTASFTNPVIAGNAPGNDGNTLAYMGYSTAYMGRFFLCAVNRQQVWIPIHTSAFNMAADNITLEGVNVQVHGLGGTAILAEETINLHLRNIKTSGATRSIYIRNNCYVGEIQNLDLSPIISHPVFGMAVGSQCSLLNIRSGRIRGGKYGVVGTGSGGFSMFDMYIVDSTKAGVFLQSNDEFTQYTFFGCGVSDESSHFTENAVIVSNCKAVFYSGGIGAGSVTGAIVAVDSGAEVRMHDTNLLSSATEIFHNGGGADSSVVCYDCHRQTGSSQNWSNTATLVTAYEKGVVMGLKGLSTGYTAANNRSGSITVSNAATTGAVTFATAESDASYDVWLQVSDAAGTPVTKSVKPSSLGTGGFTVNLDAAPGGGNSVKVKWWIER